MPFLNTTAVTASYLSMTTVVKGTELRPGGVVKDERAAFITHILPTSYPYIHPNPQ
jgi:hypothetical protein